MKLRHVLALPALALVGCVDKQSIGSAPTPLAPARWAISVDDGAPGFDTAYSVAFAPDEDVVAFGASGSDVAFDYSWITKRAREDGSERWTKKLVVISPGGQVRMPSQNAVAVGPDSSIVFVGSYSGQVEIAGMQLGPGHGALIGKLSSTGELEWLHIVGPDDDVSFTAAAIDGDGQIFVSGVFGGALNTSLGQYVSTDGASLVMAFKPSGELSWTRQLPIELTFQLGTPDDLISLTTIDQRTTIHGQTVDSLAQYTPVQVRMMRDGSFETANVVGLDEVAESPVGYGVEPDGRVAMASLINGSSLVASSTSVSLSGTDGKRIWTQLDDDAHARPDTATVASNGDIIVAGHYWDPTHELGSNSTLGAIYLRIHDATSGGIVSSQAFGTIDRSGTSWLSSIAAGPSGDIAFVGTVEQPIDFGSGVVGRASAPDAVDNRAALIGVFGE